VREADGAAVFEFVFQGSEAIFAGHFPGKPILPGVFQIEMARAAAEWVSGTALTIRQVKKAKFTRMVSPGERLCLQVRIAEEGDGLAVTAKFHVGDERAGETQLVLGRG
jgi:3-hydroxyacyl-[acyl-carrier-protein] dehydratase